jgi:uncharacterized cupredoxin-like copper-binding protein
MTTSRLIVPAVAVLAAAAIAGCGSDSKNKKKTSSQANTSTAAPAAAPTPTKTTGLTLQLSADPSGRLAFDKKALTVSKPGTVTIVMTNPSSAGVKHAIEVEGNGVEKSGPVVAPGGRSTITVDLKKAGKYEFYCPVDAHKAQGMEGELTVGGANTASSSAAKKPASSASSGGSTSGGDSGGDSGGGYSSGGGGY